MVWRVQRYGHTGATAAAFVGLEREITVNVTESSLVVHDGFTPGGHPVARADLGNVAAATLSTAGKMTAQHVTELRNATNGVAANAAAVANAQASADAAQASADAAQSTADGKIALIPTPVAGRLVSVGAGGGLVQQPRFVADLPTMKAGTVCVFVQATVPDGWTLDTSLNDRVIRVVSTAGGGLGGSWQVTGLTQAQHNHSIQPDGRHNHSRGASGGKFEEAAGPPDYDTDFEPDHDHGAVTGNAAPAISSDSSWRPSYVNAIACIRD